MREHIREVYIDHLIKERDKLDKNDPDRKILDKSIMEQLLSKDPIDFIYHNTSTDETIKLISGTVQIEKGDTATSWTRSPFE